MCVFGQFPNYIRVTVLAAGPLSRSLCSARAFGALVSRFSTVLENCLRARRQDVTG